MNISVNRNKCVHCGMCAGICPTNAIEMKYSNNTGFMSPYLDREKCKDCQVCLKYCPVSKKNECGMEQNYVGDYRQLLLAHSNNEGVRINATSGGVINELITYLLEKNIVEAALIVRHDKKVEIESSAIIITKKDIDDLRTNSREFASRYVIVPILEKMKMLRQYKNVAIVGTPCQISTIERYTKDFKNIKIFKIGIACSGGASYFATNEVKRKMKQPNALIYYRGMGWPGYNSVISDDNRKDTVHNGSLFEKMFSSQIFKNHGCIDCTDQFAEDADISFCDFWNPKEMMEEKKGKSCVIIRSLEAETIINRMINEDKINEDRKLSYEEVLETQISVIRAKKGNMRSDIKFKLFNNFVQIIFETKIYRLFSLKMYAKIANVYSKIRNASIL